MNKFLILAAGLALAASAAASEKASKAEEHSSYHPYAGGESLPEIRWTGSGLYNWERDSDSSVVLWTRPGRAYLVTLKNDCWDLNHAKAIKFNNIDAFERRLRPNDTLQFGNSKCPISDIKAIDLDAMKRDNRAKKN